MRTIALLTLTCALTGCQGAELGDPTMTGTELSGRDAGVAANDTGDGGVAANDDGGSGPACGDGVRQAGEQCDDGNLVNLDGCDNHCRVEQEQRANSLTMSFNTSVCSANALGAAIVDTTTAQPKLQQALSDGVKAGTLNLLIKFLGLDDLSGTSSSAPFKLGILRGTPASTTGYDGTNDLDWWYDVDAMSIDGSRNPLSNLTNGKFTAGKLSADPGTIVLSLILGAPTTLTMYNTLLTANSDASTALTSSSGATPGHLAGENDDPALTSFKSLSAGKLCGDISAGSIEGAALPAALDGQCDQGYTVAAGNKLLDVIVHGCTKTVLFFPVTVIKATQPDGATDGSHYTFTVSGNSVTGCTGGAAWPTCLDKAWYSSAFQFTADRVIVK